MNEGEIEKHLCRHVRELGGTAYKFVSPGKRGVPDRIVVLQDRAPFFVEVKATDGKLSLQQACRINELRALGQCVFVVASLDDIADLLGPYK